MEAKPRCLILLSILAIVVASGCTGLDPQTLATANPMIQKFLDEHPNAKILVTHFTAEQARNMLDVIRTDCDNPYIDEKEFYRVNITDPDTDFYAVVWLDWNSKAWESADPRRNTGAMEIMYTGSIPAGTSRRRRSTAITAAMRASASPPLRRGRASRQAATACGLRL